MDQWPHVINGGATVSININVGASFAYSMCSLSLGIPAGIPAVPAHSRTTGRRPGQHGPYTQVTISPVPMGLPHPMGLMLVRWKLSNRPARGAVRAGFSVVYVCAPTKTLAARAFTKVTAHMFFYAFSTRPSGNAQSNKPHLCICCISVCPSSSTIQHRWLHHRAKCISTRMWPFS